MSSVLHNSIAIEAAAPARTSFFATKANAKTLAKIAGVLVLIALCAAILGAGDLPLPARISLCVFVVATAAWACTRLPETSIALAAASAMVLFGAIEAEDLFSGLGDDVVWLLIGAFLIAGVVRSSGVVERYVLHAVAGSGSVRGLFHRLTWLIVATAFVIPSTSGRAALLLPVYAALAGAIGNADTGDDRGLQRALALLFPSVILLSACASLLGAGAHLIAVDFMAEMGLRELDFVDWALIGAPFAIVCSLVACELILRLFVDAERRDTPPTLPAAPTAPATMREHAVVAILAIVVGLWATGPLHAIDPAMVAILGALALANRLIGDVSIKDAMKKVEWNLIVFLAATLVMGEALLDSGAADWLARHALAALPPVLLSNGPMLVMLAALIAMLSHLFITSRSARAAVLIPTLSIPLAVAPTHAAMLIVVAVIGSGFCQTFRVSAKPVTLYSEHDGQPAYSDADLMRLSLWLMPPFALLLIVFALWIWPHLGLGLSAS
jgi:solute carrier family 13 (sodium-dependent dicarboxylate transporter), member 2/3/5